MNKINKNTYKSIEYTKTKQAKLVTHIFIYIRNKSNHKRTKTDKT